MEQWKEVLVGTEATIWTAIQTLDRSGLLIILVVDKHLCLKGSITDGDIRRALLKGHQFTDTVDKIMNSNPVTARDTDSKETILVKMREKGVNKIPLLNEQGVVVGLEAFNVRASPSIKENWVVLMAGGLGKRLGTLTEDCPKPMLKVGNKPLLETIIENLIEYGFRKMYISVNHKADVVKNYFQDGSRWGVDIKYLHEDQRLGTAGALSLLPEQPKHPILVMNGDILTKVNFGQLLEFHKEHKAKATMCVREYDFQVPYGVVKIDDYRITGIDEKPIHRFFVNAGIYVLDPESLNLISSGVFFDMPSLFDKLIEQKKEIAAFPVREYWLDIGHMADYDRANGEYKTVFR